MFIAALGEVSSFSEALDALVPTVIDDDALMRALFEIFDQPTNHDGLIVEECVSRGRPQGGRAVFIVNFGGGGVGVVDIVIGNNGNFGYSPSVISKIGCWLWPSCSLSRGRFS